MWRTSCGERILQDAEAEVFAETLLSLLDEAIQGQLDDYPLGIPCFDNLTYGQKIAVLGIVGNGLLRADISSVELTAVVEGAIAVVFKHLKNQIAFEIDTPEMGTAWRELVVAARGEAGGADVPKAKCRDMEEWELEVEILSDQVLWDADYEDDKLFIDFPPEKSEWMQKMAMIPDNYFTEIADDLTDEQAEATIKQLKTLCRSIVNASS